MSIRTHSPYALLFYCRDVFNNFIQLHIANRSMLVYSFNYYRKVISQKINIGEELISGQTIQIKIARYHRNNTLVIVNNKSLILNYAVKLLKEKKQSWSHWPNNPYENQLVRIQDFDQQNEVFIGGIESTSLDNSLPGFIGCLQGLMIGDKLIDLEQTLNETSSNKTRRLFKRGCRMLCDDQPCQNDGVCKEDWPNESIQCDCEHTSYRGDHCDLDIGAHFQKNSSVIYHFNDSIREFDFVDINFAFSSASRETSTLLMIRLANSTRFIHIAILANGDLLFEEDCENEMCNIF